MNVHIFMTIAMLFVMFFHIPHGLASPAELPMKVDPEDDGKTTLHRVAKDVEATIDDVEAVLEAGVDVNAKDNAGNTPLHQAVLQSRDGVIRAFLEHGADPAIQNNDGKHPIDLAKYDIIKAVLEEATELNN